MRDLLFALALLYLCALITYQEARLYALAERTADIFSVQAEVNESMRAILKDLHRTNYLRVSGR